MKLDGIIKLLGTILGIALALSTIIPPVKKALETFNSQQDSKKPDNEG